MYEHIHQSNLIEGYDNMTADEASMNAWIWLMSLRKIDHGSVKKLQKMITTFQTDLQPNQRGYYRGEVDNRINPTVGGKMDVAQWHLVGPFMDNWLLDYDKMDPIDAHVRFEKIHPFVDGNGRTGRMLLWWQQLQRGGLPTFFSAEEKEDVYYRLFD